MVLYYIEYLYYIKNVIMGKDGFLLKSKKLVD